MPRVQRAEEPCPGQGQMAATLTRRHGKWSSSAEVLGAEMTGGFPTGTFPEPSAAQSRAPCRNSLPPRGRVSAVACLLSWRVSRMEVTFVIFLLVFHISLVLLVGLHKEIVILG